jgi:hypothetical protein
LTKILERLPDHELAVLEHVMTKMVAEARTTPGMGEPAKKQGVILRGAFELCRFNEGLIADLLLFHSSFPDACHFATAIHP